MLFEDGDVMEEGQIVRKLASRRVLKARNKPHIAPRVFEVPIINIEANFGNKKR